MKPRWHRIAVAAVTAVVPGVALAEEWLGPVNTTGAVTYSMQQTNQASGETSLQHTGTLTVNPSTYIYEPWFFQINSSINMSKAMSSGASETSTNVLTGALNMNLLPQSDYPVEINYTRYSRDVQLGEDFNELTGQSLKVQSLLRFEDDWAVNTHVYTDDSVDTSGQGEVSHELGVEVDKRFAEDHMRAGLLHRESTYTGSTSSADGSSVNDTGTFRHRSHPFETVTTDSTSTLRIASYAEKDYSEESTVMQGVTTAIWRPQEVKDLAVHGAMRTFRQNATLTRTGTTTENTTRDSQTMFGTLATSYVFRPRLVGNVGVNAGYSDSQDSSTGATTNANANNTQTPTSSISYGGSGGLDFTSLSEDVEGFSWSWNTGGTLEAANSGILGLTHTESARVGHSASKQLDMYIVDGVNFSVSQNSGLSVSDITGASIPISHAVTMSKQSRDGKLWNFWHVTGSDSRAIGGLPSLYQLLNLQLTEGYDPDRFSTFNASLNFQAARQVLLDKDTGFVDTVNGQATYRQRHLLGIENLNFTSELSINPPSVIKRNREQDSAFTSSNTTEDKGNVFGTQRWTNRLDFGIGQLRTSLTARLNRTNDGLAQDLMFQVSRRF